LVAIERFVGLLWSYVRIAWWGTIGARFLERKRLHIVQAVILDEGKVLLSVRNDLWGWELPGGTVEAGEREVEALQREIREETGLEIVVDGRVGRYDRTGFRPHVATIFRCRVEGGTPRVSPESLALRWFPCDALPSTLFSWCRAPLTDAVAGYEDVERHEFQGRAEILGAMKNDWQMRFHCQDW